MKPGKQYLRGPSIDARYNISPMTRWRWQRDPVLNFRKPIIINGRKYWCELAIEEWERTRAPKQMGAQRWGSRGTIHAIPTATSKRKSGS